MLILLLNRSYIRKRDTMKSITTLFPSITKDKLRFEDAAEFEISFEERV